MQPARLGARSSRFVAATLLGILVLAQPSRAQTVLETPRQTNDRIKALSATSHAPSGEYIVGRGDLIAVDVFHPPELSRRTGRSGRPIVPVWLTRTSREIPGTAKTYTRTRAPQPTMTA